jgi:hypothetical protein
MTTVRGAYLTAAGRGVKRLSLLRKPMFLSITAVLRALRARLPFFAASREAAVLRGFA